MSGTRGFHDHFSAGADAYARFRPSYPDTLFAALASSCARHELAWDCATGSGQAALGLAPLFARVVATDASARQLEHATPHERVEYRTARAEDLDAEPGSVDLVTVAQALHWLDLDAFYPRVSAALAPGGAFAAWTYGLFRVADDVDAVVDAFYRDLVGPYWPPERRHVDAAYRTLAFPFDPVPMPDFAIRRRMTLEQLGHYLGTWSAVGRYREARGEDPLPTMLARLAPVWGAPDAEREIVFPLHVRVGRPRR